MIKVIVTQLTRDLLSFEFGKCSAFIFGVKVLTLSLPKRNQWGVETIFLLRDLHFSTGGCLDARLEHKRLLFAFLMLVNV